MFIAGIVLLIIAGLILLVFLGCVIKFVSYGGNIFRIRAWSAILVYIPILIVFLVCLIFGLLMVRGYI